MAKPMRPSQRPMPNMQPKPTHDVMAGPAHNFVQINPSLNTPKALLKRPGLGLGTRMG